MPSVHRLHWPHTRSHWVHTRADSPLGDYWRDAAHPRLCHKQLFVQSVVWSVRKIVQLLPFEWKPPQSPTLNNKWVWYLLFHQLWFDVYNGNKRVVLHSTSGCLHEYSCSSQWENQLGSIRVRTVQSEPCYGVYSILLPSLCVCFFFLIKPAWSSCPDEFPWTPMWNHWGEIITANVRCTVSCVGGTHHGLNSHWTMLFKR